MRRKPRNQYHLTGVRTNTAENAFEQKCRDNDWEVSKRGWPDFIVFPEGPGGGTEPFVVEVKPRSADGKLKPLKREQIRVLSWLQSKGIRCWVSDGETMEPYEEWRHL